MINIHVINCITCYYSAQFQGSAVSHTSPKIIVVSSTYLDIYTLQCLPLLLLQGSPIYSFPLLTIPLTLLHPDMHSLTGSSLLLSAFCPLLASSISLDVTSSGMYYLTRPVQTTLLMSLQPPSRMPQASWPKTCSLITTERTLAVFLASLDRHSTRTPGGKLALSGGA